MGKEQVAKKAVKKEPTKTKKEKKLAKQEKKAKKSQSLN
jgi:hypothetical protein